MGTTRDVRTIDRIGEPEAPGICFKLRGEFDVFDLQPLRDALDDASDSRPSVQVDLSGVTFLDVRCARELAVQARSGRVVLHDPSWQAAASLESCGLSQTATAARECRKRSPVMPGAVKVAASGSPSGNGGARDNPEKGVS